MSKYRTHNCGELRTENIGENVKIAGWVDTVRNHGGVIFLDLRDHYGVTQTVFHDESLLEGISRESVISVTGKVVERDEDTINPKIATGLVEVVVDSIEILGPSLARLPFIPVSQQPQGRM